MHSIWTCFHLIWEMLATQGLNPAIGINNKTFTFASFIPNSNIWPDEDVFTRSYLKGNAPRNFSNENCMEHVQWKYILFECL